MKKFILSAVAATAVMAGAASAQSIPHSSVGISLTSGGHVNAIDAVASGNRCGVQIPGTTIYVNESCDTATWFDLSRHPDVVSVSNVAGTSLLRDPQAAGGHTPTAPTIIGVDRIVDTNGDARVLYSYGSNRTNFNITTFDWDANPSGQHHANRLRNNATALPSVHRAVWGTGEEARFSTEIHNHFEVDVVTGVFQIDWQPSSIRTADGRATQFRSRDIDIRRSYDSVQHINYPTIASSSVVIPEDGSIVTHRDGDYQYERRAVARDGQAVAAEQNARLLSAGITNTNNHIRYSRADDEFVFRGQVRSRGAIVPAVDAVLHDIVIVLNTDNFTQSAGLRWNGRVNEGPRIADHKDHIGTCIGLLIEDTTNGGPLANIDLSAAHSGCYFSTNPSSSPIFTITE